MRYAAETELQNVGADVERIWRGVREKQRKPKPRGSYFGCPPRQFVTMKNGLQLAYTTYGSKTNPALVLVHGASSDQSAWPNRLVHRFVENLFVICFDNRDSGQSSHLGGAGEKSSDVYSMVAKDFLNFAGVHEQHEAVYELVHMAGDIIGLLDFLGVEKTHVVGHSMGGMISQVFALEFPHRCLSMTLINTTAGPNIGSYRPPLEETLQLLHVAIVSAPSHDATFDELVEWTLRSAKASAKPTPEDTDEWFLQCATQACFLAEGGGSRND